ncbi:iron deficiency-induced protein A [Malaciobacter pacificus]|jgi:iron(III) transport system substrate-binding protein|uniref:Iron(III)/spermidine/putrescine ABC transporter, periplasmic substrate-binding protein n=1 Tax=Malaciobacter pacificus TaxID=1080223 RepID=A0A5C2HEI9_9BACT|nr:Fe(3+) ABC transporter substrate-binding protein [Malaciobacter pacificus]QEP35234.1 iron(III)/spermidine/putrescine ABC transporter, periplasmic substrate-binding protein [Malaciobacter pacificus]GGD42181.1 iron deficiency-induced protein A [Malaciobacter pacificus]
MIKKLALSAIVFASSLIAAEQVNVYSSRHYDTDKQLFKAFEKNTGIKVKVIQAKDDALIKRLQTEGKNSPADVFITVDAARIQRATENKLFQPIDSKILTQRIPSTLRDKDNQWFAITKRARIIAVREGSGFENKEYTYEELADPKYKGQIMVRSSSNVYNQSLMAAMIAHHGVEYATKWAEGVVSNMAREPKGSDRDQARGVAAGLGSISILNTYYLGKLAVGSASDKETVSKLKVIFPKFKNGATHVNVSAAGVAKYAKNKENAIKFIEFLTSKEAQEIFAKGNYEYPVVKGSEISELVASWGVLEDDNLTINDLGANNANAVKALDIAGWK